MTDYFPDEMTCPKCHGLLDVGGKPFMDSLVYEGCSCPQRCEDTPDMFDDKDE